ncbi:hypothetical protein GCM10027614_77680 [Micromonospora vulcania]
MTIRSIRRPLATIGLIAAGATLAFASSASANVPLRAAALTDGAPLTAVTLGGTGKIDASGARSSFRSA